MARSLAMEIRHLRTIVAVARHGSLTKAGDELFLTQSAISQQIRRLEEEWASRSSTAPAAACS
jgi:DNA-binding transcriptional LysR family regulator